LQFAADPKINGEMPLLTKRIKENAPNEGTQKIEKEK